jgi:predicted metal-dependent hydrolase
MPSFQYGQTTIDYTLKSKPDSKDISIAVEWLEGVTVTTPENIDEKDLVKVLHIKAPWILKKWYELNEISDTPQPKEYVSGEKFQYLGKGYRLKVNRLDSTNKTSLGFYQGRFHANVSSSISNEDRLKQLSTLFKEWYISHGQAKVNERLSIYCPKMDLAPQKFALKEQKMRWGTCTSGGAIYLNWRIMMAPMSVVDYVIVHELAHLKHQDHSRFFWQLVHSILPDYEHRKEWLRVNGPQLTIDL